nr:ATP-binding cassette domain-containing protein [Desulfovibrio sp.]
MNDLQNRPDAPQASLFQNGSAQEDAIRIFGAGENNLKHIDLAIPKKRLVVFAGVSGSGKSSLAFDTLAVESAREWQAGYPLYLRNKMPHYARPKVDAIEGLTPAIVVNQKALGQSSRSTVGTAVDAAPLVRLLFSRAGEPSAGGSMAYSFNHPAGMCPVCTGLGKAADLDEDSLFDPDLSLAEGAIRFSQFSSGWQAHLYQNNPLLDAHKKLRDFTAEELEILRKGSKRPVKIEIRSNNTGRVDRVDYEGVLPRFRRLYLARDISKLKKSLQEEILSHVVQKTCPACHGARLNPAALASRIGGRSIVDFLDMPAGDLLAVLGEISSPKGASVAGQLAACLRRMEELGIGYLSLGRPTDTLSGGELQRLKMVRSLGSSLSDVTYIFDEPTAGLHPADAERIGRMLLALRARRNNVLVVEHSRQMLALADRVIELGPGPGAMGGRVVYEGSPEGLRQAGTATAAAMAEPLAVNPRPQPWRESYRIEDACSRNLKHVCIDIPKGVLTAVCGPAGSGKSSLACFELAARHPEAVLVSQKPAGASIRSTPATYTGVMDEIRRIFAKASGADPGWFSFNAEGACPACRGAGQIAYEMAFAEPVVVPCEECQGRRYNPRALSYRYRGLNIEEVLSLTIAEALDFFGSAKVKARLKALADVGLGYLALGQPMSALSGGEVQRVKLAGELHREGGLYVLDEPGTGMHASDAKALLALLRRLAARRCTVVFVEHRLELVAQADWIIEMGPEGGSRGGEAVFCGTPEDLLRAD